MFNKAKKLFLSLSAMPFWGMAFAHTPPLPVPVETKLVAPHTHAVANFNDHTINHVLWPIVTKYTAFPDIPEWYANSEQAPLPLPAHTKFLGNLLTLRDAIWIALRNNPDVKNSEVQRIEDKFALEVAQHAFVPQFTDQLTYSRNMTAHHDVQLNTTGQVELNTPFATNITSNFTNTTKSYFDHRNTYETTITQPLMNGGWLTPWYAYLDSVATEQIAKLTFRSNIMTTVTSVISAYTALVQSYNSLDLNKAQYRQTIKQINQDKLRLKVGRMSRSDFTQEAAQLATDKLGVVQAENSLQTTYQAFLVQLGLVSTVHLQVDRKIDTKGFGFPNLETCIKVALKHNTTYLTDKLNIGNAKRDLITAINGLMPTLTATADFTYGNGQKTVPTVGFTFSVPIDDISARSTELSAKVSLEQAKIALASTRQTIISDVTSDWQTVQSNLQQIKIAEQQIKLQQQVVNDDYLSLQYGRTSMFQYLEDRTTLLTNQQNLVNTKIAYITSVATLDQEMGVTLKRWNIKLRY